MMSRLQYWWFYLSELGISTAVSSHDARWIRLLNRIAVLSIMIMLPYIPLQWLLGFYIGNVFSVSAIFLIGVTLIFNYYGKSHYARIHFISISIFYSIFLALMAGKNGYMEMLLIVTAVLPLLFFRNEMKFIYGFFIVSLALLISLIYIQDEIKPLMDIPPVVYQLSYYLEVTTISIMVFLMIFHTNRLNSQYETEIETKNRQITDSINYASRIQKGLLPDTSFFNHLIPQNFIIYKPKDIVSGDFYWVHQDNEDILCAVADCTGHGVPGAMVSVLGKTALERAVTEFRQKEPARILNSVNQHFSEILKGEQNIQDGMDIALCRYTPSKKRLSFAGAKNSLWIISSQPIQFAGSTVNIIEQNSAFLYEIKGDRSAIGKHEVQHDFKNHECILPEGSLLYIFTDGYPDQFGGPQGKKFKYLPLKKLLLEIHRKSLEEQKAILEKTFTDWKGNLSQLDDVCLIGLRLP